MKSDLIAGNAPEPVIASGIGTNSSIENHQLAYRNSVGQDTCTFPVAVPSPENEEISLGDLTRL